MQKLLPITVLILVIKTATCVNMYPFVNDQGDQCVCASIPEQQKVPKVGYGDPRDPDRPEFPSMSPTPEASDEVTNMAGRLTACELPEQSENARKLFQPHDVRRPSEYSPNMNVMGFKDPLGQGYDDYLGGFAGMGTRRPRQRHNILSSPSTSFRAKKLLNYF